MTHPISHLVINDLTGSNSNTGRLPEHHLNKVTGLQRKQLDIYFLNPDRSIEGEQEYYILSIEFSMFEGLYKQTDPIRWFKKAVKDLIDCVSKDMPENVMTTQSMYGLYTQDCLKVLTNYEDIMTGNYEHSFNAWMNIVTSKTTFSLSEISLLRDYQYSYYTAVKLLPNLLGGHLFASPIARFDCISDLLDFCNTKQPVKTAVSYDPYSKTTEYLNYIQ